MIKKIICSDTYFIDHIFLTDTKIRLLPIPCLMTPVPVQVIKFNINPATESRSFPGPGPPQTR